MKLEFALIWFALLLGTIVIDEVLGGDDGAKHTTTTEASATTTTEAATTTTPEPTTQGPVPIKPGEQKDYILTFMSHGFNVVEDNLFNYTWKQTPRFGQIFDYEKGKKENFSTINYDLFDYSKTVNLYMHEPDLNRLLKANYSIKYPGNYSYQLYHSTYYGRVAAETFLSQPKFKATLDGEIQNYFSEAFKNSVTNLIEHKNYTEFLAEYGTHYFKTATFGGMIRMQSHTTNKFVRDVSEEGFKKYLKVRLNQTLGVGSNYDTPNSYDFYYHSHSDNSTYGGDKKFNFSVIGDAENWRKDLIESDKAEVVPIDFTGEYIYELINLIDASQKEIINGLNNTIVKEMNKFKVKSYMEAMDVVRKNPYGKSLGGSFDAQFLYSYFEDKLKDANVTLDEEFEDNAWAAEHNAQAILNRRGWFEKPYPPYPTTLAPTTEPTKANATEAAATTEATTKKA